MIILGPGSCAHRHCLCSWNQVQHFLCMGNDSCIWMAYILRWLKTYYAAWQLTLLESLQKRCDFLEHVAEAAGLTNVKVVRNRAEVELYGTNSIFRFSFFVLQITKSTSSAISSLLALNTWSLWWLQDSGKDIAHRETYDIAVARAVAEMRVLGQF